MWAGRFEGAHMGYTRGDVRYAASLLLIHIRLVPAIQPLRALPAVDRRRRARRALRAPAVPVPTAAPLAAELEYVHGVVRGADAEEGADEVEVEGVDARLARAAAELVELLRAGHAPDADDGTLVGRGREERAAAVEGEEGDGRLMCLDDVCDRQRACGEEEDVAC